MGAASHRARAGARGRGRTGWVAAGRDRGRRVDGLVRPADDDHRRRRRPTSRRIIVLWGQIRQWRHEARMDVEPAAASVLAMRFKTVGVAASACPDGHQAPPACNDVCDPADAICDNAERICRLAGELTQTPWASWARDKCDNAKGSCREAKQRCCGCERRAEVAP